jgi:hypothetical protein
MGVILGLKPKYSLGLGITDADLDAVGIRCGFLSERPTDRSTLLLTTASRSREREPCSPVRRRTPRVPIGPRDPRVAVLCARQLA